MSISARIRTITLAIGFAVAVIAGLAAQPASAAAPHAGGADAGIAVSCWNEYTFDVVGSTVYASAFKDCVHLEAPQGISFSVEAYIGDEWGSYWVTWKKGSGNIVTTCPPWTMVRHSITRETIMCP